AISEFELSNPTLVDVVKAMKEKLFGGLLKAMAKLGDFESQGSIPSGVGGLSDIASIANSIFTHLRDFVESSLSDIGPGPLKEIIDKVTASSRAKLGSLLKPDLIGSLVDLIRYGQEELFDYSMTLFSPLNSVTH